MNKRTYKVTAQDTGVTSGPFSIGRALRVRVDLAHYGHGCTIWCVQTNKVLGA